MSSRKSRSVGASLAFVAALCWAAFSAPEVMVTGVGVSGTESETTVKVNFLYRDPQERQLHVGMEASSDAGATWGRVPVENLVGDTEPQGTASWQDGAIHWLAGMDWPVEVSANMLVRLALRDASEPPLYMVVDVSGGPDAASYPVTHLTAAPSDLLTNNAYSTSRIVLRHIPAGTYTRGSPPGELGRSSWGEDQVRVTLTQGFYIGVFQVTQAQYQNVTGADPSEYKGARRPVETVSWEDVRDGDWPGDPLGSGQPAEGTFVSLLRAKTGGVPFDLPTESQWEYACRAGTTTSLNSGLNITTTLGNCPNLNPLGRYVYTTDDGRGGNYKEHTSVGSYLPNAWGLYDMHGNVREWCLDWYSAGVPPESLTDPLGPSTAPTGVATRTVRAGGWNHGPNLQRSAWRDGTWGGHRSHLQGFRLASQGRPPLAQSPPSARFLLDTRGGQDPGRTMMLGAVSGRTAAGESLGPIRGATVSVSGLGSRTTAEDGAYRFDPAAPGTYAIEVSAPGYYPGGRAVSLEAGQTRAEYFALTLDTGEGPLGYNLQSPRGKHFIEGLPGNVSFVIDVDWRGSPGTVRYLVGGNWRNATVTNLSASRARATLTVPIPSLVAAASGLHVEVTNGEGIQTVLSDTGVWFYPQPEMLTKWFGSRIPWKSDFSHRRSGIFPVWDLTMRGAPFQSTAAIEYGSELAFDPEAGSLFGWRMGKGLADISLEIDGVRFEGSGHLLLEGENTITLRGDQTHLQASSWIVSARGRPGASAPTVRLIPVVFPPAAPAIEPLLRIPGVRDLVTMQRLGLYKTVGLELRGTYEEGEPGGGWLGATGVDVTGTIGLEAQLAYELWRAKAGVYVGGEGSPTFTIYPDLAFRGMEFRAYVGAFASAWYYRVQQEVGVEVGFGDRGEAQVKAMGQPVRAQREPAAWEPVGPWMERWGEPNRLPHRDAMGVLGFGALATDPGLEPTETRIMENVLELAAPSLVVTAEGARILFAAYDDTKPFYASTDIGQVFFPPVGGGWITDRLTDNEEAEFFPAMATPPDGGVLAAWSRVVGDASETEGPEDIDPLLEIAASRFDPLTGQWGEPELLTNTGTVSRDPLPVAFGGREGVLYVQNEGDAIIGGPEQGDSLMFIELDGAGWGAPQELWFGAKGIVEFAFAEDGDGNGHVVMVVDEDGDLETTEDWRLYWIGATSAGWQSAALLTETEASDAAPALVSPGGAAMCVWSRDGTLHYSALDPWNPRPVHGQEPLAGQAPTLAALTMPGGAAIAYTAQFETDIDIVAAFYDVLLDRWSLPIRLTRDEHAETAISMAWDGEANELALAYLKTQTLREDVEVEFEGDNGEVEIHTVKNAPQPGRTDLYVLRHSLGHDLAVEPGSLRCDPSNPAPGSQATLSANVLNLGELSAGTAVAFYKGDPADGGALIGQAAVDEGDLLPGGAVEVSALWDVPVDAFAERVFVVVDPEMEVDDRDRANNAASLLTVLPDLALVRARDEQLSPSEILLTANVKNNGVVPPGAAFAVYWRADSPEGDVVAAAAGDPILPGASREIPAVWAAGDAGAPGQYRTLHLSLAFGESPGDFDASNNVYAQSVRLPYANGAETVLEIAPAGRSHGGDASEGNEFSVIANVAWTAMPEDEWILINDGEEGQGQGTVAYSVEANDGADARMGAIAVSGGGLERTFEVFQAGDGQVVLSYAAGPGGSLQGETFQVVASGGDGSPVEAVPSPGHRFERWSDGRLENPRVDAGAVSDVAVQAEFAAETWALEILDPEGEGATDPAPGVRLHFVYEGATAAALPAAGWRLDHWRVNGQHVGDDNPIGVPAGSDGEAKTLQAVFAPMPQLRLAKTPDAAAVAPGAEIVFTIAFGNDGPAAAEGVVLRETLPPGVQFQEASGGVEPAVGELAWHVPSLQPGEEGEAWFRVKVDEAVAAGGTVANAEYSIECAATPPVHGAPVVVAVRDFRPPKARLLAPRSGLTPERPARVPPDTVVAVEISGVGSEVDLATVRIRIEGELAYDGSGETKEREHATGAGVCRRADVADGYRFYFFRAAPFAFSREVAVSVEAGDMAGNAMAQDFSFRTMERPFGAPRRVNDLPGGVGGRPSVFEDEEGNLHAAWAQDGLIRTSMLPAGSNAWTPSAPVADTGGVQSEPAIVAWDEDIGWVAFTDVHDGRESVVVTVVDDGAPEPSTFLLRLGPEDGQAKSPAMALSHETGRLYIAWQQREAAEDAWDIVLLAAQLLGGMHPQGADANTFNVTNDPVSDQTEPALAVCSEHAYMVWTDARNEGRTDLYGASSEDGWKNVPVLQDAGSNQSRPALAMGPGPTFHVAWEDDREEAPGVFYASGGDEPINADKAVNVVADGQDAQAAAQRSPSLQAAYGQVFVAWDDDRYADEDFPADRDVFFAEKAVADEQFGAAVLVSPAPSTVVQEEPALILRGGEPAVLWRETEGGESNLFGAGAFSVRPFPPVHVTPADGGGVEAEFDPEDPDARRPGFSVPPNSVETEVDVVVSRVDNPPPPPANGIGVPWKFGPSGLVFREDSPATIEIPVTEEEMAGLTPPYRAYRYDEELEEWTDEGVGPAEYDADKGVLRFTVQHFTLFAAAGTPEVADDPGGDPDDDEPRRRSSSGGCTLAGPTGPGDWALLLLPGLAAFGLALRSRKRGRQRHAA